LGRRNPWADVAAGRTLQAFALQFNALSKKKASQCEAFSL
jgi:hypothetical protein